MDSNKAIIAGLIAGLVAVSAVFAAYAFGNAATGAQQLLFVQTASSGLLAKADTRDSQEYILTLNDVSPKTIYFTDRPHRMTGVESTQNFVDYWSQGGDSFTSDPPNAAIEFIDAAEHEDVIVVELTYPVYDSETKTLQYRAIMLQETGSESLSNFDKRRDDFAPETFGRASLFIDSKNFPQQYCNYYCPDGSIAH